MIHTVYIDDSTIEGMEILRKLPKNNKAVRFDKPLDVGTLPEGYMTSSDFRAGVKQGLKNKLKANGYLPKKI